MSIKESVHAALDYWSNMTINYDLNDSKTMINSLVDEAVEEWAKKNGWHFYGRPYEYRRRLVRGK